MAENAKVLTSWSGYTLYGVLVIVLGLGSLGAWAATARLDAAAIASGFVDVESNRKEINHLEGGIVRAIFVRDSQKVKEGDVLLQLEPLQAKADVAVQRGRLINGQARAARLTAERDDLTELLFSDQLTAMAAEAGEDHILRDEIRQFEEGRIAIENQLDILSSRIEQLQEQSGGREIQKEAMEKQYELLKDELEVMRVGVQKGVVPKNRLLETERNFISLGGDIGNTIAEIAGIKERIGETRLQKQQITQERKEVAIQQLAETRIEIIDATEKLEIAQDMLSRVDIRAPLDGVIQNLSVHTVGGVVAGGAPLMEIVPAEDNLIVKARLSPLDRDTLHTGLSAEVRFPAFASRTTPIIYGTVDSISPDTLADERTGEKYYEMQVVVDNDSIPDKMREKLVPGLPSEVMVATGERTPLEYLIKPLRDSIIRAGRED